MRPSPLLATTHVSDVEGSMSPTVIACGGFLLAVLWMDLMFDVQVLRHRGSTAPLPEDVLASIAAYYRRVTTDAEPRIRSYW